MWQALKDWLPDLAVGTIEIRDIANLVVALLGVLLAWLAIRMGREQGKIAARQGEIAEKQHQILEDQLAKRSDLRVTVPGQNRTGVEELGTVPTVVRFQVMNGGNKTADGCRWEILIQENHVYRLKFLDKDGTDVPTRIHHVSDTLAYRRVDGVVERKIYPGDKVLIIRMSVSPKLADLQDSWVLWRVKYDEGIVPAEGYTRICFVKNDDDFDAVTEEDPFVAHPASPDAAA